MKEKNFQDCTKNNTVRTITPDPQRQKSLTETAEQRISLVNEITEKNCNFVFEDYYTSIIEILQAKAFKDGYNILNHICLGFYLRDFQKRDDLYTIFDDIRYKRNSLTYYGIRMDYEVAKDAIDKCKRMLKELA